jgi:uncharacterized membrane-anchored protein
MILLQAAMAMGFVLLVGLIVFLAIGTPLLVIFFMKLYRSSYQENREKSDRLPYYKEPIPFILSILVALFVLIVIYFLLVDMFFCFNPDILKYS